MGASRRGQAGAIEDGNAVLRVRDTGIGIAPEVTFPGIFEFYAQGPSSSESNRRGLGVGLALVRQLVELHSGSINASSAGRGEGSEFIVRLSVSPNQSPSVPITPAGPVAVTASQKVLVIDDEEDAADALSMILKHMGHQVWTAYSGSSGIETALAHRPAVALVDLSMPDMDGYEVARQLRERSCPVLFPLPLPAWFATQIASAHATPALPITSPSLRTPASSKPSSASATDPLCSANSVAPNPVGIASRGPYQSD